MIRSKKYFFSFFDSIKIDSTIELDINLVIGSEFYTEIIGEDLLIRSIRFECTNECLNIKSIYNTTSKKLVKVIIHMPKMNELLIMSLVKGTINNIQSFLLNIIVTGIANLEITGSTNVLILRLMGIANIDSVTLNSKDAHIAISGKSNVSLSVSNILEAKIYGIGKINYYGNPEKIIKSITGNGTIDQVSTPHINYKKTENSNRFNEQDNISKIQLITTIRDIQNTLIKKLLDSIILTTKKRQEASSKLMTNNEDYIIDVPKKLTPIIFESDEINGSEQYQLDSSFDITNYSDNDSFDQYEYHLGTKNKKRLGLTNKDENYLNKIWHQDNVFIAIQECCDETIKLFLFLLKSLKRFFLRNNTSLDKKITDLGSERLLENEYYHDKTYWTLRIYTNLFKISESVIREKYNHKRKLDIKNYLNSLEENLDSKLESFFYEKIQEYSYKILKPSKETLIELNFINKTRWKDDFENIECNINNLNVYEITEKLDFLYSINIRNYNLHNIYFYAFKLLAKIDRVQSLIAYTNYFYLGNTQYIEVKKIPSSVKKIIFKEEKDYKSFINILEKIEKDNDINPYMIEIKELFLVKKKKIILDQSIINEVKELHSGTLEKLNEVLKEDEDLIIDEIVTYNLSEQDIDTKNNYITNEVNNDNIDIKFSSIQKEFLNILVKQNGLSTLEVENFAKSKNIFKNQLINSINELSFDIFDDSLIDEVDENYTINLDYINKVNI